LEAGKEDPLKVLLPARMPAPFQDSLIPEIPESRT
jgi:hypothetical protein